MIGSKRAMLVSEVGWKGIRELSLSLLKSGLLVDIIIKGSVNKEVLEVITKPAGFKIYAIPRWFFKAHLFFCILWHKIFGNLTLVVATKERTRDWINNFGIETKLLIETEKGYELS